MLNAAVVSVMVCGVGLAQASVITGLFSDPYGHPAVLTGLGVAFTADGWSHNDTSYHEWWMEGGEFLENPDGHGLGIGKAFLEGAVLSDAFSTNPMLRIGTSTYIFDDGGFYVHDTIGEIGQSVYLGFRTSEYLADEDRFAYRYGFIQAVKRSELQYEYVGWAYETSADASIVTFNLVPAPSAGALLGLAGLVASRRRH